MFLCLSPDEARTNIGLSPPMGFLNENDRLVYFAILRDLSSDLSFTMGFFSHYQLAFSDGKEGHTSQHPDVLVGLRRPNIRKEIVLAFCTKFERHTSQRRLSRNLGHVKYVLPKGALMPKTVATLVQ